VCSAKPDNTDVARSEASTSRESRFREDDRRYPSGYLIHRVRSLEASAAYSPDTVDAGAFQTSGLSLANGFTLDGLINTSQTIAKPRAILTFNQRVAGSSPARVTIKGNFSVVYRLGNVACPAVSSLAIAPIEHVAGIPERL
jgi:hypothetical protein